MNTIISNLLKNLLSIIYVAICGAIFTAIESYKLLKPFENIGLFELLPIDNLTFYLFVSTTGAVFFVIFYRGGAAGIITISAITAISFLNYKVFHIPAFIEWLILAACGIAGYILEVKKHLNKNKMAV